MEVINLQLVKKATARRKMLQWLVEIALLPYSGATALDFHEFPFVSEFCRSKM